MRGRNAASGGSAVSKKRLLRVYRLLEPGTGATHASVRKKSTNVFHYERLEFLGDRVLGLAVAELLFHRFPEANEGELSLRLNTLVKGKTLAEISDELELHEFIRTGGDLKELKGKRMQSVRADVLEALIASIYIDGGQNAAVEFIKRFWRERLDTAETAKRDSKTSLQEWAHAERLGTPRYKEKKRTGPDHDPVFTVVVQVNGKEDAIGEGRSKRHAEQQAAREMLIREGVWDESEESL
ncbi:MAG: ribonuclease III [Nitratireductor sp.]|nr:ribonuclease III [Nitratireductor sp.]